MNPPIQLEGQPLSDFEEYYKALSIAVAKIIVMSIVLDIVLKSHSNQKLIGHWSCCNCIECKQRRRKTGQ